MRIVPEVKFTPEYENTVAPHKSKKERKKLKLKCLNKIFKMTIIIIWSGNSNVNILF